MRGSCLLEKVGGFCEDCRLLLVPPVGWPSSFDDLCIIWCGMPGESSGGISLFRKASTDNSVLPHAPSVLLVHRAVEEGERLPF